MKKENGNCLFLYGGGLVDSANCFLRTIMDEVKKKNIFKHIYVGRYSFEALLEKRFIMEWTPELKATVEQAHGGYFGTCRGVDLTEPKLQETAIEQCKARNIKWVFVAGGDGSSRQVAEIAEGFKEKGIMVSFIMPCAVDGIEGGAALGIDMAVKTYVDLINNFANATLCTRDNMKFSVSAIVLQGRNRDDLLAYVLKKIVSGPVAGLDQQFIDIFVIPANYEWDKERLIKKVESSKKPVLLLISEGATLPKTELHKTFSKKKVRIYSVGHLAQVNGSTTQEDIEGIKKLVERLIPALENGITKDEPFSLVVEHDFSSVRVEKIDYYAKLNPREGQNPTLKPSLETLLKMYLP